MTSIVFVVSILIQFALFLAYVITDISSGSVSPAGFWIIIGLGINSTVGLILAFFL